jgi:hypothetical protein
MAIKAVQSAGVASWAVRRGVQHEGERRRTVVEVAALSRADRALTGNCEPVVNALPGGEIRPCALDVQQGNS